MKIQYLQTYIVPLAIITIITSVATSEQDAYLEFEEIVENRGYRVEQHKVTTDDGYILFLHRIPGKLAGNDSRTGPPVLLMHGLIDSSDCWVINDVQSPAFVLAEAGYDIWLGNARGTKRSKGHTSRNTKDPKYWDFSWEENGKYDNLAFTEYILQQTGAQKLAYIGHSMGSTQGFYSMSLDPDYYKKKWSIMIALAPPASMDNITSALENFMGRGKNAQNYEKVFGFLNMYETFPYQWPSKYIVTPVCKAFSSFCKISDKMLADEDPELNDFTAMNVYFSHYPSGGSMKTFLHLDQQAKARKFQLYDYLNAQKNVEKYGQETPPEVELHKIKDIPIALLAGEKDKLASIANARKARDAMSQSVVFYKEYNLGHLSFMAAKDMSYFQNDVISLLKQYHPVEINLEQ